jgi:hypothetical protein
VRRIKNKSIRDRAHFQRGAKRNQRLAQEIREWRVPDVLAWFVPKRCAASSTTPAGRYSTFRGGGLTTMKSIRRNLGAFTVAAAMAAVLAVTPSQAEANSDTSYCDSLLASIANIKLQPYSPYNAFILFQLEIQYKMFCSVSSTSSTIQ